MLQLSYVAEDDKGKIVGYVLAKMWVCLDSVRLFLNQMNIILKIFRLPFKQWEMQCCFFLWYAQLNPAVIWLLVNPLEHKGKYGATSNNISCYTGCWWVGCYIWCSEDGTWCHWRGPQPTQTPPCCTKFNSPPMNNWCANHHIAV